MITHFDFVQPIGKNFTPSAKIFEFAKSHNLETSYRYDQIVLHYPDGGAFAYHHYEIEQRKDETEKVTIYMEDIIAWERHTQAPLDK